MPTAEDIYLFRHAAYRDVAYRLQIPSDRAELHALALEIMERVFRFDLDTFAYELAEHARQAREQGAAERPRLAESEAKYVLQALERIVERAQWDMAVSLCQQAASCPALSAAQSMKLQRELARALHELGRVADALEVYEQIVASGKRADDVEQQIHGLAEGGGIHLMRGDMEIGFAMLDQAEALAETRASEGYPDQLASIYISRSHSLTDYDEVEKLLTKAQSVLTGHPESHLNGVVRGNLANLYGGAGRHEEAVAVLKELVIDFARQGEKRSVSVAWANIGRQLLLQSNYDQAEGALQNAIAAAAEIGNARTEAFARANLATLQVRRGAFRDAQINIGRAIEIARDHELTTYLAAYLATLAEIQLLLGHERDAQGTIEDSRAEFVAGGGEAFIPEYCSITRLRIAASLAVSMEMPGRATSKLTAAPPSATWLPIMREIQAGLHKAWQDAGNRGGILLEQGAKAGAALLAEIKQAVAQHRPALVYRGHLPSEMQTSLRIELLTRMTAGERASLSALHPALLKALQS